MSLVTLVGIGLIAAILIFMFFKLGENKNQDHFVLQIVCLGFVLILMFLTAKTVLDEQDYCEWRVTNTTVTGNTTLYSNDYVCKENEHITSLLLYKTIIWLIRLVVVYVFIYIAWSIFDHFQTKKQGRK